MEVGTLDYNLRNEGMDRINKAKEMTRIHVLRFLDASYEQTYTFLFSFSSQLQSSLGPLFPFIFHNSYL